MQISEHFTLEEFERSDTARRLGIDNKCPRKYWAHLTRLCVDVLEPLRASFQTVGAPTPYVTIHSGYRCSELNRAVGGVAKSHHLIGCAADITIAGHTPTEVYSRLLKMNTGVMGLPYVPVTQVILYRTFVHVSYIGGNKAAQFLTHTNK